AELDEAVVLEVFSVSGAALAGGASTLKATGWILDNDGTANPLAAFVSRPEILEGDAGQTEAVFEISLSRPALEALTLSYETVDGGAVAGEDYVATSGTIDLVAGQTSAAVRVPVLGDTEVEFSETFALSLSTASTALAGISIGSATVLDDDAGGALPTLSVLGNSTFESLSSFDQNSISFAVTLSEAATETVTLSYRLLSGMGQAGFEGDAYIPSG
ncbi:MAG: Calx-beta domain-containing protein, partial [Pseudomonadota bacterium]